MDLQVLQSNRIGLIHSLQRVSSLTQSLAKIFSNSSKVMAFLVIKANRKRKYVRIRTRNEIVNLNVKIHTRYDEFSHLINWAIFKF